MDFSIVITTHNRNIDLAECLNSIIKQTFAPSEIIIIDNSPMNEAKKVATSFKVPAELVGAKLIYIGNPKENSLTAARNLGIIKSSGEIVLFLDDDVVLDRDYLKQIAATYDSYPDAVGVQGYYRIGKISSLGNWLKKIFFLYHYEKNYCRILRSVNATYPYNLKQIIPCQWLSGANHSWKREAVDIIYDEKLKKYSEGEDLDFSYRLYKKYPGRLYITPFAKLEHKASVAGRAVGREPIFMNEVYGMYLFFKLFGYDKLGLMIFAWSRIGKIMFAFSEAVADFSAARIGQIILIMRACLFSMRHIGRIREGDVDFFNRRL